MPHLEKKEGPAKLDSHTAKVELAREHHAELEQVKQGRGCDFRPDRHSGTGHSIKESPKKAGGGGHNWGSYKDDIAELKQEGVIH